MLPRAGGHHCLYLHAGFGLGGREDAAATLGVRVALVLLLFGIAAAVMAFVAQRLLDEVRATAADLGSMLEQPLPLPRGRSALAPMRHDSRPTVEFYHFPDGLDNDRDALWNTDYTFW